MAPQRHAKQVLLEKLLDFGMVMVILDARRDGVDVPGHLRRESQLRLNLSYRFGKPLAVDHEGVRATLTYGGVPYETVLPWDAIYAVLSQVSGHPYVFPDDIPRDVATEIVAAQQRRQPRKPRAPAKQRPQARPQRVELRVIEGSGDDDPPADAADSNGPQLPGKPRRRRKPRLRLVK